MAASTISLNYDETNHQFKLTINAKTLTIPADQTPYDILLYIVNHWSSLDPDS